MALVKAGAKGGSPGSPSAPASKSISLFFYFDELYSSSVTESNQTVSPFSLPVMAT